MGKMIRPHWLIVVILLFPVMVTWAQNRWVVPHVPTDTRNFKVSLVFEDLHGRARALELAGYSGEGVFLDTVSVMLAPGERVLYTPSELFADQPLSYFFVSGKLTDDPDLITDTLTGLVIGVSLAYASASEGEAFIPAIADPVRRWRVHSGNWETEFDGVAIVNLDECGGSGPVLHHYTADGELIQSLEIAPSRGPFRKTVLNLSALLTRSPGSYAEIESTFRTAVTALRGSLDFNNADSFLVGNLAQPLPDYEDLRRELEVNRERWRRRDLSLGDYKMDMRFVCFCPGSLGRPVQVAVRQNWIESLAFVDDEEAVPLEQRSQYRTIESLFELVERAIDVGVFTLMVTFDPVLGYPTAIGIDQESCLVDEERTIIVENLEAL